MSALLVVIASLAAGTLFGWLPWLLLSFRIDDLRAEPLPRWWYSTWLLPFALAYLAAAYLLVEVVLA